MKLCYPIATPDCSVPLMAFCGDFEANLEKIRAIGYEGVELLIRDLDQLSVPKLLQQVKDAGLEIAALATSPCPSEDNVVLAHPDKKVRGEALRRGKLLAGLSREIGAPVLIGRFRGLADDNDPLNSAEVLKDSIRAMCDAAGSTGRVLIEEQQKGKVNVCNTVAGSLQFLEELGRDNTGLLLDTFHMEASDPSISIALGLGGPKMYFVHLSDTKRLCPGAGSIDFTEALGAIAKTGYRGFLSMEVNQTPDSELCARLCHDYIRYVNDVKLKGAL